MRMLLLCCDLLFLYIYTGMRGVCVLFVVHDFVSFMIFLFLYVFVCFSSEHDVCLMCDDDGVGFGC